MFHRLSLVVAVLVTALLVRPAALAVKVHVRVEGKERTIFGATAPLIDVTSPRADALPENALDALESASVIGEFYYHVTPTSFGPVYRPGGPLSGSRTDRLGVQAERRVAAGGRGQARLKDGDTVLWYWAQFGVAGGPKTLVLQRGKTTVTGAAAGRPGATSARPVRCYRSDRSATVQPGTGGRASAATRVCSSERRSVAQCARMPFVRRLALVLAVAALAGCGGGESGKATLWVTRDQGAQVSLSR